MSQPIKLSIEHQFEMRKISDLIEQMSHEQLKEYALALQYHHFTYIQVSTQMMKDKLMGVNPTR